MGLRHEPEEKIHHPTAASEPGTGEEEEKKREDWRRDNEREDRGREEIWDK